MAIIIDGNAGISFNDSTSQNTSSVVNGKLPLSQVPAGTIVQAIFANQGDQVTITNSGGQSSLYGLPSARLYADLVSLTITPKSASNNLLFMGHCGMTSGDMKGSCAWGLTLVKNNTTGYDLGDYDWYSAASLWAGHVGAYPPNQHYQYIISAGSTSSQTWYLKAWNYSEGNTQIVKFRQGSFVILEVVA